MYWIEAGTAVFAIIEISRLTPSDQPAGYLSIVVELCIEFGRSVDGHANLRCDCLVTMGVQLYRARCR